MKSLPVVAVSALALAACSNQKPMTRTALDCPATQGQLTRTAVAPDGKTCTYVDRNGGEISLRLIPVSTTPQAALGAIEKELEAQGDAGWSAQTQGTPAPQMAAAEAAKAAREAGQAAQEAARDAQQAAKAAGGEQGSDDDTDVDTGPVHVHVNDGHGGDHANIDLPGLHIHANGDDQAEVNVAGFHIDASDNGAVIRKWQDVRLRGQALSPQKRGFLAMYIVARDDKAMGYEAAGPKTGPIAVAVVRNATGGHHDNFIGDINRLVKRNGGV